MRAVQWRKIGGLDCLPVLEALSGHVPFKGKFNEVGAYKGSPGEPPPHGDQSHNISRRLCKRVTLGKL